jgi:hypothetical protein
VLPGTHFSLLQEPKTINHIAQALRHLLPAKKEVISSA